MNRNLLLGALVLTCSFGAQAAKEISLKVGQSQQVKIFGTVRIECVSDQVPEAGTKISNYNVVTRGGALDSQDKAFMIPGEFIKRFSPIPTNLTASCMSGEEVRRQAVNGQEAANDKQDYEDFKTMNNKFWECGPGGLLGSTQSVQYRAASCNQNEALKASQFKCYQDDRFGMHGCEQPVKCYIVKMNNAVMCDYILPDEAGNFIPYPH